ncbi:MAG: tRNA threonylcarbamoyladenosine dehydratase, partial [Gammaproteobacteria bacterium]|nr:tRNA threonylcarbamoyladenosine dehydratase [Gammaproteobacteria bacterium]
AVEALARSAIGHITMIDPDHVCESNVNRQIHALDGEFGKAKVTAMAERVQAINPHCTLTMFEDFITRDNLPKMLDHGYTYVIDCIDDFKTKAALIYYCRRNKIKIVTVGGAGGQIDPTRVNVSDLSRCERDPLLAKTRKLLRQDYGFTRNLKRRFGVPCVYSDEQIIYPTPEGGTCHQKPKEGSHGGLNCSGGFGSTVTVTAVFGLAAVSHVLARIGMVKA